MKQWRSHAGVASFPGSSALERDIEVVLACLFHVPESLGTRLMLGHFSLVPSPPPQLSSFAVRITQRRPGRNYHVMYATVYVIHASL